MGKEGRGEREDEDGSQVHFSLLIFPSRVRPPLLTPPPGRRISYSDEHSGGQDEDVRAARRTSSRKDWLSGGASACGADKQPDGV